MSAGIPIQGERHFNVRMHENWSAEMPLEMFSNPLYFGKPGDMSTVTPQFIEWVRKYGSVETEWEERDEPEAQLSQEFDFDDTLLMDRWREAVHQRSTTHGFDQWRSNLIQAWKVQAQALEGYRRRQQEEKATS